MTRTLRPDKKAPPSEHAGFRVSEKLIKHIKDRKGQFLKDLDGSLHLILNNRRIPLRFDRDNLNLARLVLQACGLTTMSAGVQTGLQRLQVEALDLAGHMQLKRFSALSPDRECLYVPIDGGKLLLVTAAEIKEVANGENPDYFWVEHPYDAPLKYSPPGGPMVGLDHFERLLVNTQACSKTNVGWLVAMDAGFFPYLRDSFSARFLMVLIGSTQQGKTSGAQRFTRLHGLGDVIGDFSVAALNSLGDIGLLVLDNKEQANFTQQLIDHCLFLATGAQHGRAQVDGKLRTGVGGRPVGIITTIEGVVKAELKARCVEIQYGVRGARLGREEIEREIEDHRNEMGSAMMSVLQRYLQIRSERRPTPNPIPNFGEHFTALCDLLRAFGEVAGRPSDWAEGIICEWDIALSDREPEEDELEHPILRVLSEIDVTGVTDLREEDLTYKGTPGTLYVTDATSLLTRLQTLTPRILSLPKNASGLTRRLGSIRFRSFAYLETDTEGVPSVRRRGNRRPLGFFRPNDEMTEA